jgi:hypothetical protein
MGARAWLQPAQQAEGHIFAGRHYRHGANIIKYTKHHLMMIAFLADEFAVRDFSVLHA